MVKILYFARLREDLGKADEALALPAGVADVQGLREHLIARGGAWASALAFGKAVRISVNQDMVRDNAPLRAGDEVAFFPPVTGG